MTTLSGRVVLPRAVAPVRTSSLHLRIRSMSTSPQSSLQSGLQGVSSPSSPFGLTNHNGNAREGDQTMMSQLLKDSIRAKCNGNNVAQEVDDNDSYHDVDDETTIRASSSGDTESDIDLPSVVSMEILESAIVAETKQVYRRDDVEKRVAEMHKIVADAQNYLHSSGVKASHESRLDQNNKETQVNNDEDTDSLQSNEDSQRDQRLLYSGSSRAMDSLVLIRGSNGPSLAENASHAKITQLTASISSTTESESESSSLTQESPLYRTPNGSFKNSIKTSSVTEALHLPLECLPNLTEAENELIETLKKLQSGIDDQDDDDLYNDPHLTSSGIFSESHVLKTSTLDEDEVSARQECLEIIDLTALPPPGEEDYENLSFCNRPLTTSSRLTNDSMTPTNEATHSLGTRSSISGNGTTTATSPTVLITSSCSASSNTRDSVASHLTASSSTSGQDKEEHLEHCQDEEEYRTALLLGSQFEDFLASVSIPPPPSMINRMLLSSRVDDEEDYENIPYLSHRDRQTPFQSGCFDEEMLAEDELSSLIVPPPPSMSEHEGSHILVPEDDVIANFWKATHDVKQIYAGLPGQSNHIQVSGNNSTRVVDEATTFSQKCKMFTHDSVLPSSPSLTKTAYQSDVRNSLTGIRAGVSGSCSDSGYDSIPLAVNASSSTISHSNHSLTATLASSSSETSLSSSASFCTVPSVHSRGGILPAVVPRASIMTIQSSSQANKTSSNSSDIISNTCSLRTTSTTEEKDDSRNGRDLPKTPSETQQKRSSMTGQTSGVDGSMIIMQDESNSQNGSSGSSFQGSFKQSQDRCLQSSVDGKEEKAFHDEYHYKSLQEARNHTTSQNFNANNGQNVTYSRTSDVEATHLLDMSVMHAKNHVTDNCYSSEGIVTSCSENKVPPSPPLRASKPPIPPVSQSIIERRKQLAKKAQTKIKLGMLSCKDEEDDGDDEDSQSDNSKLLIDSQHPASSASSSSSCTSSSSDSSGLFNFNITNLMLTKSFGGDNGKKRQSQDLSGLFIQVVAKIDQMITHMEEMHECRIIRAEDHTISPEKSSRMSYNGFTQNPIDEQQLNQARDCLVLESRAFVTSSKLFVKSSTEGSDSLDMIDHLVDCLSLLEKMYKVSNVILFNCESQVQATCLVDRLKEVAATFALTIETVRRLFLIRDQISIMNSTETNCQKQQESQGVFMGQLMSHATCLATSLSALMRTLRAFSSY